jgi:hypothetical protein
MSKFDDVMGDGVQDSKCEAPSIKRDIMDSSKARWCVRETFHHSPRLGKHKRSIVPKLDNCIAVWKMAPVICKALEVS